MAVGAGAAASGGGSAAVVIGNAQPAGLSNNSYYCFMNSGLQCLFATKGFLEATQRGPFHRHQRLLDELGALGTAVSRTHDRTQTIAGCMSGNGDAPRIHRTLMVVGLVVRC